MLIGNFKDGFAVVTKNDTVISLGWKVWGIDSRHGYFIVHPFSLKVFKGVVQ